MAKIKILIKGYVIEKKGEVEFASSTTTLIQDNNLNIIVDPGMHREWLLFSLNDENLSPEKIDFVVLTHTHIDHCFLTGIFTNAKILDDTCIYSDNGEIGEHDGKIPGTSIEIIQTPGHDQFHCSILVDTEEYGKVAIVGDVFWWADDQEQKTDKDSLLNHKDPYVKDKDSLRKSREKVLELADYIIPGHGKMFKIKK
ncbi:MBL fold metallo-hydrolase [Patescibacteria group bacterium]|nr:MBL fold metallo-hydrolase [Patescibacteria group bacterium]